ncbi:EcsC family protein [Clostridium gasigenes]|uniref:EcsC family protein n=1 Tax=Clostridium gasigenes TaxID=94869 RepID=UPI001C0AE04F|nr:EcsC family protein [Clostridium gasigenes]MBU3135794.1 EcsC family protein [Clostridium gasigenes]
MAIITQEQMKNVLDTCYKKALEGLPGSESVIDLSQEYIDKYRSRSKASEKLAANQVLKCGTSGFITGLGGLITLPVAIPVNISSVIYMQLRMIASIAYIGGYDPSDDEVQTMAYLCLTGTAMSDVVKSTGIKVGEKVSINLIKKIPGTVLTKINQKVGFRLITKFGEKGIINLAKMVPLVGGIIGGGVDLAGTKVIGNKAINVFINGVIE